MRKPTTCIGKNKAGDQLCSNCTADQRLCFRCTDSTILLLKAKISSFQHASVAWFLSDMVGNPNCWFSHAQAHFSFPVFKSITNPEMHDILSDHVHNITAPSQIIWGENDQVILTHI